MPGFAQEMGLSPYPMGLKLKAITCDMGSDGFARLMRFALLFGSLHFKSVSGLTGMPNKCFLDRLQNLVRCCRRLNENGIHFERLHAVNHRTV